MYCEKCGAEISDGMGFCPACGQPVAPETQNAEMSSGEPETVFYGQPEQTPVVQGELPNVLLWGILGLSFSCSWVLSFLGIIFSAIALSKAKLWQRMTGLPLIRGGKAGKILATIGLILGIAMTVFFIIWLIAVVCIAVYAVGPGYGYYR